MVKKLLIGLILVVFSLNLISAIALSIDYPLEGQNYGNNITNLNWSNYISNASNCWFKLNGGANTSFLCNDYYLTNNINSIEGNNTWIIYVNDSLGSISSTQVSFWVDSIYPAITILNPTTHTLTYTNGASFNLSGRLNETNPSDFNFGEPIRLRIWDPTDSINGYDQLFLGLNGASLFEYEINPMTKQGNYTYLFTTFDTMNHETNEQGIIIRDTIAPNVFLNSPQNGENLSGVISIVSSANDERSGINSILINISQGSQSNSTTCLSSSCNFNWNSPEFSDGQVNISIVAVDNAANTNSTIKVIEIDNTKPQVLFNSPNSGEYNISQLVNITASDAHLSKIELYVNDILNFTLNTPSTFDELNYVFSEGNYSIYAKAYDSFGNTNQTQTRNILVDLTAPVITLTGANPQMIEFGNNYSELGASANDIFAGNVTSGIVIDSSLVNTSAEGIYFVFYSANDSVNNLALANRTVIINDTTSPVVAIVATSPENNKGYDNGTNFVINYTATDFSGIASCYLLLNDAVNLAGFNLNNLLPGKYNYSVVCNDSSSNANIGASETRTFTINSANENQALFSEFTNLSSVANISQVYYFFVSNSKGSINFSGSIDFSSAFDWSKYVNISDNRIEVNSSAAPLLNTSAIITLYNITWITPQILVNGIVCASPSCNVISYNSTSGVLVFSVASFSTYTTQETPVSSGGSSGGGGSGSSGGCSTTWSCTAWSTCNSALQIRTCSKVNPSCYATDMPLTARACSATDSSNSDSSSTNSVEESPSDSSSSPITGAVIGTIGKKAMTFGFIFIALVLVIYLVIRKVKSLKVQNYPENPFTIEID